MDLKEDLQKKLQQLRSLVEHPGLYIVDLFYSLRNEVDYDTESLLLVRVGESADVDLGKRNIDGLLKSASQEVAALKKIAYLNQARQQVIDELNRYQALSLLLKAHVSESAEYLAITTRVASFMNTTDLDQNEYEREIEYESIAREIWRLENEMKRTLLANRTFYFFKNRPTELGVLFVLEDFYLNEDEIDCLN